MVWRQVNFPKYHVAFLESVYAESFWRGSILARVRRIKLWWI